MRFVDGLRIDYGVDELVNGVSFLGGEVGYGGFYK